MKPSEKSITQLYEPDAPSDVCTATLKEGETYRCNKAKKLAHTGPRFLATLVSKMVMLVLPRTV